MKKIILIGIVLLIILLLLFNISSLLGKLIPANQSELVGEYALLKQCIPSACNKYVLTIKKDKAVGKCFDEGGDKIYTKTVSLSLQGGVIQLNTFNNDFFDFPYFSSIHRSISGKIKIPYMINGHCEIEQRNYLVRKKVF